MKDKIYIMILIVFILYLLLKKSYHNKNNKNNKKIKIKSTCNVIYNYNLQCKNKKNNLEKLKKYKYTNFNLYYPNIFVGGKDFHKWDNNGVLKYGSINYRKQPVNRLDFEL